jgi:hypothetical protein
VVYFVGRGNPALLLATLAQRMFRYVPVSDALPCPVIPFPHSRIAVIAFISSGFLLGMFITEPAIGQLRAAGMRTRALGFIGQLESPRLDKRKALVGFPSKALVIIFDGITIPYRKANIPS